MPRPYWDPKLRKSSAHLESFLRRLYDRKLVSFRRAYKAEVGIFFVKKKHDKIRMIVDCRQANFCHQVPPRTRLGSAGALSELDCEMLQC